MAEKKNQTLTLTPLPEIDPPLPRAPVGPDRPLDKIEKKEEKKESIAEAAQVVSIFESSRDALVGIPSDLLAGRGSLMEIFTKNNRLRGLGVILVLIAVFVAVSGLLA